MLLLIWSIVKFILLLLLVLLLVLLALAALVLLVPFCYRAGAKVDSERMTESSCGFQVSWLFRFLFLSGSWSGSGLTWSLRILGIRVMPRKPKRPKNKMKEERPEGENGRPESEAVRSESEADRIEDKGTTRPGQGAGLPDDRKAAAGDRRTGHRKKQRQNRFRRKAGRRTGHPDGADSARKRAAGLMRLLAQEETRQVLARVFHRLVKVLRHIAPRRAEGVIAFGLTDPSYTGMLLGLAGMCLPAVGMRLRVHPDFRAQKNSFSARVQFSGHIILAVLAARLLPLVLDKEVRRTYRRMRNGGDE